MKKKEENSTILPIQRISRFKILMAMLDNVKKMHEDELKVISAEKVQIRNDLVDAE